MADYDLKSRLQSDVMLARAILTATPAVTAVDTLDYGSVSFLTYVGAGGITFSTTNKIEFIVYESDDNSTFTVAADDSLILAPGATAPGGTGIARAIIAAHAAADAELVSIGYRGKKRYAKCIPTFGGTHGTGTIVGVDVLRGHPYHKPIGASAIEV
jgi:hypothetical protein